VQSAPSFPARILVYGVTGSGKSTLARRIGERLGLSYHSVDDLTWQPGWILLPMEAQRELIAAVCAGDSWVIDSAYSGWLDIAMGRAELIVGLDFPRWLSLSRLLRRCVVRVVRRTPVCNGNVETWRALFAADSIVAWHFHSFGRKRRRMRQWHADPAAPPVLLFRRPRELTAWLNTFPAQSGH
jgi:adenylate kinase family enzyme